MGQPDMYPGHALAHDGLRVLLIEGIVALSVKHGRSSVHSEFFVEKIQNVGGPRQELLFPPKYKNFSNFSAELPSLGFGAEHTL